MNRRPRDATVDDRAGGGIVRWLRLRPGRQQLGGKGPFAGPVDLLADRFPRGCRIEVGRCLIGSHQTMGAHRQAHHLANSVPQVGPAQA